MSNSDITKFINNLESSIKVIKDEIFKISWYMRGGVTSQELLHIYSYEDRTIMSNIIKDNIETTQKTKLPFV
jgi:hypothetical protein